MLLGDIIRLYGRKYPDKVALVDTAGEQDRVVTFGELRDRMLQVANAMTGIASEGDRIGMLAENLPE